jgi:hypothetical protein
MTRLSIDSLCLLQRARRLTMAPSLALSIAWSLESPGVASSGAASTSAVHTAPSSTPGSGT